MHRPIKPIGNKAHPGQVRLIGADAATPAGWMELEDLPPTSKTAIRERYSIAHDADLVTTVLERMGRTADGGFCNPTRQHRWSPAELDDLAEQLAPRLRRYLRPPKEKPPAPATE